MRPKIAALGLAVILVSALAACHPTANDTRRATQGLPNTQQQLTANEWVFDHDASSPSAAPTIGQVTIRFTGAGTEAGRLSGSAPCNQYSGRFVIDHHDITITHLTTTTQRPCRPQIVAAEQEYLTALRAAHHVQPTNQDQLQLTGGPTITLTYNAVRPT